MNKLGKAGFVSALVLAASAVIAGPGHGSSPVGEPGKAAQATRTVNVDMTDNMRFTPSEISVKQGETVRIVVKNSGAVKHELVLGTPEELKEHYAMMLKMPGMEHADDNMVSVAPGKTGEIVWRFTKVGKVDFACLQPGHYDAGMKGLVNVAQEADASKNDGHGGHGGHKH
ncbi:MAG: cupredoxin family protein [Pseudomonadota bacterium]